LTACAARQGFDNLAGSRSHRNYRVSGNGISLIGSWLQRVSIDDQHPGPHTTNLRDGARHTLERDHFKREHIRH
jgi:hypothetical protein